MAGLSIRNVRKRYGTVEVLKGIDIEIADGEFLILVGPSGCGKSTLLNMLAGLESTTEGEIRIGERTVNGVSPKDRDIAMVFQSYALYPSMTVRENIGFAMEMRKIPRDEREATIARVSKMLQIDPLLDRRPAQLSGGQRQRVAMGRAMARNPAVFLFDEPLSNLDAKLRVEMRSEIKALRQRLGTTTVYVTHDQVEAMTLGDRIAVMKDGLVQQLGTPEEIYARPSNLYVAGFIGSPTMNLLPVRLTEHAGRWRAELRSTAGNLTLTLPPPREERWRGTELLLGLRPEHFHECEPGSADALPMCIDLVEPTGADTFAVADINGQHATVRLSARRKHAVGDTVWLQPDAAVASLFDPNSGIRVGA
jgi:multiple sugar transport system ATP-binding protein